MCGERAIRVDILERLADLIRPALAWREGASGAQAGRRVQRLRLHRHRGDDLADRRSGEDFASILRSLGYRMEKRPKPPEAAKPESAAPAAEGAATAEATEAPAGEAAAAEAPTDTAPAAEMPAAETAEHAPTLAPDAEPEPATIEPAGEPPAAEPVPATEAATEPPVVAEASPPESAAMLGRLPRLPRRTPRRLHPPSPR